jgi:hypothetical protein
MFATKANSAMPEEVAKTIPELQSTTEVKSVM